MYMSKLAYLLKQRGTMELKITSNLAIPFLVVALVLSAGIGFFVGKMYPIMTHLGVDSKTHEVLASSGVRSVSAELQGKVVKSDKDSVVLGYNGEQITIDAQDLEDRNVSLTIISELSEEDKSNLEQYQKEIKTYEIELDALQPTEDVTEEDFVDIVYPEPPTPLPFELYGADPMTIAGDVSSHLKREYKEVLLVDLQPGDEVQASVFWDKDEPTGRVLRIYALQATRGFPIEDATDI